MNNKLKIAEILKDKPQGTKLYTPISGDVWLVKVEDDEFTNKYPIIVSRSKDYGTEALNTLAFTAQGQYMNTGECLLFPSKNMRDWEKFAWKRGDMLKDGYGTECMFDGWSEDDYAQFNTIFSISTDTNNEQHFYEDEIFNTEDFYKIEGVRIQSRFIKSLEEEYGGTFNPETLEIEKPKPTYKEGDIIYSEIKDGYKAISIFKELSDANGLLVYVDYFLDKEKVHLADKFDGYNILCDWNEVIETRLATEEEKQLLFSKLEEKGKRWNPGTKRIEDLHKEYEFKPFDKVLVRDNDDEAWQIAFFSHIEEKNPNYPYYVLSQNSNMWAQCIPYEGNEELFGTSNKPKEECKQ